MNIVDKVYLEFISPELMEEFFTHDSQFKYEKIALQKDLMTEGTGLGVIMSEGNQWKMKRKLVNEIFTFDFMKAQTPLISNVCDRILDTIDKKYPSSEIQYNVNIYTAELAGKVIL